MMKYHEQIKHPLWQKKRLEVLELHEFTCQECNATESELHIHHPFYKRGAMIWDYDTDNLQCLCNKCHLEAHAIDEELKYSLSHIDYDSKLDVLGYIDAMYMPIQKDNTHYIDGYCNHIIANHADHLKKMIRKEYGCLI